MATAFCLFFLLQVFIVSTDQAWHRHHYHTGFQGLKLINRNKRNAGVPPESGWDAGNQGSSGGETGVAGATHSPPGGGERGVSLVDTTQRGNTSLSDGRSPAGKSKTEPEREMNKIFSIDNKSGDSFSRNASIKGLETLIMPTRSDFIPNGNTTSGTWGGVGGGISGGMGPPGEETVLVLAELVGISPNSSHAVHDCWKMNSSSQNFTENELYCQEDNHSSDYIGIVPKSVYLFFIYILMIGGLFGNVMVLVLMQRGFPHASYSVYLRFLAVADSVSLIMITSDDIFYGQFNSMIMHHNLWFCKLWSYIIAIFTLLSPWYVVALTFDRYIALTYPLKGNGTRNMQRSFLICLVMLLSACLESIYYLVKNELVEGGDSTFCWIDVDFAALVYFFVCGLFVKSVLPCILLLPMNIRIIVIMKRSTAFRKSLSVAGKEWEAARQSDNAVAVSMVAVSLMAFITMSPLTGIEAFLEIMKVTNNEEIFETQIQQADNVWPVCNLIRLLNFAVNFYVMMLTSRKYRKEFRRIFNQCETWTVASKSETSQTEKLDTAE